MLQALLRRDRATVLVSLVAVILLAWAWLLLGAGIEMGSEMDMGGGAMMLMRPAWTPGYALLIFLMWAIMMLAMMLPSAAPTILLIAALGRSKGGKDTTAALFTIGYLLVWTGFSLIATSLQWVLDWAGALSGAMAANSAAAAGALLIAAGIYQWTPLKQACLRHCRSPLAFLLHHWRSGSWGAVSSGLRHGVYCLGCCWMLMALLFVGGLMDLVWIAALALLILIEKTLPWGGRMSTVFGAALVAWGTITLVHAV
jgi:predicted metal-binding membrane protein